MGVSRRQFLKGGGLAAGALALTGKPAQASIDAPALRTKGLQSSTTICPYCAVGCGVIVHTRGGEVINTEGDPDHPINRGTLCPKGSSLYQLRHNPARITTPLYRGKGEKEWKPVSWDWAFDQIARKVKETRDATFITANAQGQTVNRTDGIASVGSAALDNEECYLYQKFLRGLGLVYIEHQARI